MLKEGFFNAQCVMLNAQINVQCTIHNAQCSMVGCLVVCYFAAGQSEARNLSSSLVLSYFCDIIEKLPIFSTFVT